jgi:hypothetical protein
MRLPPCRRNQRHFHANLTLRTNLSWGLAGDTNIVWLDASLGFIN